MKLLIFTQKVDSNDDVLGFFYDWLREFSKKCERVTVVCLQRGQGEQVSLPSNVRVFSLGKETGRSRLKYVANFYRIMWQERQNYDTVFVHMNQVYVLLGGPFWRLWGKRIGLWYVHRQVSFSLWLAALFAHDIFSSSPESFRLSSNKVHFVGHGINMKAYEQAQAMPMALSNEPFTILHIGRITPIKNCDTLVRALKILTEKWKTACKIVFVGSAGEKDQTYFADLKRLVDELGLKEKVEFSGSVPNSQISCIVSKSHMTANLTPTGGTDKAVLESLAAGVPVFASNQALRPVFGTLADLFQFPERNEHVLAQKIMEFFARPDAQQIVAEISTRVRRDFSVEALISKIVSTLSHYAKKK